jgi:hypothetical protein
MAEPAMAFLQNARNPDEGWGYGPGQGTNIEATAAVALASAGDPAMVSLREDTIGIEQTNKNLGINVTLCVAINAIEATVNCNCTVNCGQKGGDPRSGDALIPALVH